MDIGDWDWDAVLSWGRGEATLSVSGVCASVIVGLAQLTDRLEELVTVSGFGEGGSELRREVFAFVAGLAVEL